MRGGRSLDLDFSALNATPRTGLESFQQSINEGVTLLDKYLDREQAKEERKAREAEDLRRFDLQQARLDTQDTWQRQKYDESILRQNEQDKIAAEDRKWNRNRQIEADTRTKELDKIAAEERAEKKAKQEATENFQQNLYNIADKAILGTTAGKAAENELLSRAMQETANLAKADEKYFGKGSVDEGSYRTPDPSKITDYGKDLAIAAAKPYADRGELVRVMNPALKGTNVDPESLTKGAETLGVGVDTEALKQAREKQARELTNKLFSADGKGSITQDEDGNLKVTSGNNKGQVSFIPNKLSNEETWFGMGDSAQMNIAQVASEAKIGNMPAPVRDKMLERMLDAGYLKVGEGKLEEGKSLGAEEFKVIHKKALEDVGTRVNESQDPLDRWNSLYRRVKQASGDNAISSAVASSLRDSLGEVTKGRDLYSAPAANPQYSDANKTGINSTVSNIPVTNTTNTQTSVSTPENSQLKAELSDTEKLEVGALQEYLNKPTKVPSKAVLEQAAAIARDNGVSNENTKYLVDRGNVTGLLEWASRKGNSAGGNAIGALGDVASAIGNIPAYILGGVVDAGKDTWSALTTSAELGQRLKALRENSPARDRFIQNTLNFNDRFRTVDDVLNTYDISKPTGVEPRQTRGTSLLDRLKDTSNMVDMTVATKDLLSIKDPKVKQEAFSIASELKNLDPNSPKAIILKAQLDNLVNQ